MAKSRRELKTRAIVLRRTNYGEADRVLQVLTPEGKVGVLARGVRKEKSRLAGGIELFSVSEMVLVGGKGDLMTLTGVRLLEFYGELLKDWEAMELMSGCLKEVGRRAEQVDVPEYFSLLEQVMKIANEVVKSGLPSQNKSAQLSLIRIWWALNILHASGEDVNLSRDIEGEKLAETVFYMWDARESAMRVANNSGGALVLGVNHIKLMRLMMGADLGTIMRVKNVDSLLPAILEVIKALRI